MDMPILHVMKKAPHWLIEGLSEAVIAVLARVDKRPTYRIDLANGSAIMDERGISLGRLIRSDAVLRFEPADLSMRLAGSAIDVELPPAWVWRRSLQPIGADNVAYLDAFVSHHIERISPWRSTDVYHKVSKRPIENDPTRLAIDVGIVPKQVVDHVIKALGPLAARLHLVVGRSQDHEAFVISVGLNDDAQRKSVRRLVIMALTIVVVAATGWLASAQWATANIEAELVDLDRQIAARRAALAVNRGGSGTADALQARRAANPYLVELIDALSRILPDHAYLLDLRFEKDLIRVTGISGRTSELVSALERSGRFSDVKFAAATTRQDDGRMDRFHLEMRVVADPSGVAR